MLRLENIKKNYYVADMTVEALKGINLCFRKSEFVSILGPSGCGKTTLLNIIGGLDQYTSGDLVINGRSTKEFTDHDWDVYRNHRIGFIFQSYNLIPHQTVLGNVELALTIAGLPKAERIARAKKALDRVGLSNQYYKKPNQMSGGQCQRVAIARALVNEPEILLADEPTGALDTETSIQIMELIKEIASEKLVIMVTHNPDLAYKYSTRIVKCLDGNVLEDSKPFSKEEEIKELEELKNLEENSADSLEKKEAKEHKEKAKMSLWTAFKLSARNLNSKFKRTFMVALAGCIGIVGVSTVLAVSNGVQNYIADMENDMLSGNPVYISSSSLDYSTIMSGGLTTSSSDVNPENDKSKVYISSLVQTLVNMNGVTSTNKITQEYMDFLDEMPEEDCELIQYKYGDKIASNIYTSFKTGDGQSHEMSVAAIQATYASVLEQVEEFSAYASMINSVTVMTEMPSKASYIESQYDVVYIEDGMTLEDVLESDESLIAVASQAHNTLNDLELAEYGYFSQAQFLNYCYKLGDSDLYDPEALDLMPESITYEKLAAKKFTWYPNDTVFSSGTSDDELGDKYYASAYSDGYLSEGSKASDSQYDNYRRNAFGTVDGSVNLNVKCVLKLKEDLSYGCLTSGGLYYTNALSEHMREYNKDSDIVKSAEDNGDTLYNVELGYAFKFDENDTESLKTHNLSSSSSAIMDYIAQFMGSSSSSGKKTVSSYSLAALGGAEFPSTIYFYTDDFEQKDLLTEYLDTWNDSDARGLYKINDNGYYVGKTTDADGNAIITYYYYDEENEKYYQVLNVSEDGLATDSLGGQYKLSKNEDDGQYYFYRKLKDNIGDAFTLDGSIKLSDNISINAYTLASYVLLGDKFDESNVLFDTKELVENKGGHLYRYLDYDGNYQYVMEVENQSYYKVSLDKNGNVIATRDGYDLYRYDEETDKFYKDEYVEHVDYSAAADDATFEENTYYTRSGLPGAYTYTLLETQEQFDAVTERFTKSVTYTLESTEVDSKDQSKLYAEEDVYNYANGVKNPTFTINDEDYTLDTHGLYMDTTSLSSMGSDYTSLLQYFHIDQDTKIITIKDYSQFTFYYRDMSDTDSQFFYVDYGEEDGVSYLYGTNISSYLDMTSLSGTAAADYISDKYILNDDGTLQAVTEAYSSDALTPSQMKKCKVIGDELKDLSILEKDDSLQVKYTDMIGLIIGMVNTLIQIITYALVAFTALSLVVSTVMIGIITYVSVVERTKEIGVIRALGGRKKDVRHLFNAETLIIGFSAGVLGIAITYLLSLVINLIIGHFAGIYTIAALPWYEAIIMILISIGLTLISGLIPASSAAKKDPVIALRTE